MDDLNLRDSLKQAREQVAPPEPAYERLLQRRDRKRRNARLASALTAFVIAAAAVTGTVIAFGLHGSGKGSAPHRPAAGSTGPNLVAGSGQYYYWKTVRPIAGGDVVEQIWWGEDGSGKYQVDSTNPNYGTPQDQTWGPGGLPENMGFPFEGSDVSKLSTDPQTLLGQLLERSGGNGASPEPEVTLNPGLSPETSRMWRSIQNLIEQGNASAPLRVAIFEVAAGLDGVQERTGVQDPVGRPAVSLSVQLGDYYCGGNDVMYFEPQTHLLLASNGDLGCSPSVIVVAGGIVGSRSEVAAPGEGLIPEPVNAVPEPSPLPSAETSTIDTPTS